MHWDLKERKCVAPEKKDEKVLEGISILYVFLCALLLWWKRKQKQGGGKMIREAVRKMEKNLVIIFMAFHSGLSLTRLNMAIRDLYYIYLENF